MDRPALEDGIEIAPEIAAGVLNRLRADEAILMRLGRAVFEYQERQLPEGETWESLSEGDREFWRDSAHAALREAARLFG